MTSARVALGTFAFLLTVAACSSAPTEPASELKAPVVGENSTGLGDVPLGNSVVVPMGPLCTTRDPITVTSVEAWAPTGGIRVTSWGTRYLAPDADVKVVNEGGIPGRVEQIQGFSPAAKVRARCDRRIDDVNQFDVSVAATSAKATMRGVIVHYRDDHKVNAHMGVLLCEASSC